MQKGKKSTFKTTGMSSVSHAEYTNYGPDIASVSDKGVVKGKKYGSSHFIVRIDYKEYYITTVVGKPIQHLVRITVSQEEWIRTIMTAVLLYTECSSLMVLISV